MLRCSLFGYVDNDNVNKLTDRLTGICGETRLDLKEWVVVFKTLVNPEKTGSGPIRKEEMDLYAICEFNDANHIHTNGKWRLEELGPVKVGKTRSTAVRTVAISPTSNNIVSFLEVNGAAFATQLQYEFVQECICFRHIPSGLTVTLAALKKMETLHQPGTAVLPAAPQYVVELRGTTTADSLHSMEETMQSFAEKLTDLVILSKDIPRG
eukprot:gb/GECH01002692.1/.p1 GENE.gb/GECH01002692.1/~~gb/GECH01002692.1/.p1  ORF type:complete len:210 (+),score=44.94 gb/GECH01002692.1/:1-630(+)